MKGPIGFGRMVNLVMNILMGISISLVVLISVHAPLTPDVVVQSWFCSFIIGYTFGDLIPIASLGPAICGKLGIRGGAGFYIINSICLAIYFGTVILFGMSIINNLATAGWGAVFGFFAMMWPIVAIAAIIFVLAYLWLAQLIAKGVSGFDPAKAAMEAAAAAAAAEQR